MSKVAQRLLVFFLGIPLILGIVYFNALTHLPFNILLTAGSALAAYELCAIFSSGGEELYKPLVIILCAAILIGEYIELQFKLNIHLFQIIFILAIFIIFAVEIFDAKTFEKSNARITRSICVLLYCGFLPSFITRLSVLQNSFAHITTFLVLVFLSDSAAWFFGVLFGKNNRGIVPASPNKSVMGFIGAYIGCILFAYLFAYLIFPAAFVADNKAARVLVLAIVVCTASVIGDLAESVFKRSANIKDSGKVIMGRGGMLDCVDSVFMAAPFYYYLATLIF